MKYTFKVVKRYCWTKKARHISTKTLSNLPLKESL